MMAARERPGLGKQVLKVAPPARRVFTSPEAANRGRIEDLLNTAPKAFGGLRQSLPDWLQNLQHRLGIYTVDWHVPDRRAVSREGQRPLRVTSPATAVRLDVGVGAFSKTGNNALGLTGSLASF